MTQNNTMLLISGFVALIVAVALVIPLSESSNKVTTVSTATQIIDFTTARLVSNNINPAVYFHLTNGCPYSNWRQDAGSQCNLVNKGFTNSSGAALASTNYVFATTGAVCTGTTSGDISFVNSTTMVGLKSNTTTVTYTYCGEDYVTLAWGQNVLKTTIGLFALCAFLTSVGCFYAIARNNGMLN